MKNIILSAILIVAPFGFFSSTVQAEESNHKHGETNQCITHYDSEGNIVGETCVKSTSDRDTYFHSRTTMTGSRTVFKRTKSNKSEVREYIPE